MPKGDKADKKEKKEKAPKEKKEKKDKTGGDGGGSGGGGGGVDSALFSHAAAAAAAGAVAGFVASQQNALQQQPPQQATVAAPGGVAAPAASADAPAALDASTVPAVAAPAATVDPLLGAPATLGPPYGAGIGAGPPPSLPGLWPAQMPASTAPLPATFGAVPPTTTPMAASVAQPPAMPYNPLGVSPLPAGPVTLTGEAAKLPASPRLGNTAMYEDYRRCLVSLEEMINGPLQQKKAALIETAKQVEANMEAVQRAAGVVRSETNADVAGITERLEAAERQKLSLLQHDLTAYMLDLDAIEAFVRDVAESGAGGDPAAQALRLLQRQPELFARGQRLLQKSLPGARAVAVDDLPRETAERTQQLARVEELERLLRVKDAMLWSMLNEGRAKDVAQAERGRQLDEARAAMQSLQQGSRDELQQWSGLVEDYAQRVDGLQGELADSRQQAAQFAAENEQLRTHNEQLLQWGETMRSQLAALHEAEQAQLARPKGGGEPSSKAAA